MRRVSAYVAVSGTVHEAESLWLDTSRWPAWVDGLARIDHVDPDWPAVGATVTWESTPAGRGRVTEEVAEHVPLERLQTAVRDASLHGRQEVTFTPADDGAEVVLTLDYEITKRTVFTPLVDVLFIRGALQRSLQTTLVRFAAELEAR